MSTLTVTTSVHHENRKSNDCLAPRSTETSGGRRSLRQSNLIAELVRVVAQSKYGGSGVHPDLAAAPRHCHLSPQAAGAAVAGEITRR
jgi:hypothetical protein